MVWACVLLCLATPVWALAPDRPLLDFAVRRWTVDEGLPHNTIHQLGQSADGYLWLATWEGLVRFDGRRFRVFDRSTSPGLTDDGIRALLVEPQQLLLGSSAAGLLRWRQGTIEAVTIPGLEPATRITTLERGEDGSLWIGTEDQGALRIDPDGALQTVGRKSDGADWVYDFWLDSADGSVLIATQSGVDRWRAGQLEAVPGLPQAAFHALREDRRGRLWAGGAAGLFVIEAGEARPWPMPESVAVSSLLEDRDGDLWIGSSSHGLFRQGRFGLEHLGAEQGLSNNRVTSLFEDADGLLWIGTNGGLSQLNDAPISVIDRRRGLSDDFVRAVTEAPDRSIWIATSGGLNQLAEGQIRSLDTRSGLRSASLLSLWAAPDGVLWVGSFDQGIDWVGAGGGARDPPRVQPFPANDQLASLQVRSMLGSRDGSVWIGTSAGLNRWHQGRLYSYGIPEGLPRPFVLSLFEDPQGQLWVGTADGIARYDAAGDRFTALTRAQGLPAQHVFDFASDRVHGLLMATDGGLVRYRDGRFDAWTESAGLPANTLFRVLTDTRSIWLTSNVGLLRLSRRSLAAYEGGRRPQLEVEQFGRVDGMGSSQCNGGTQPAGLRSRDGRLWVPTAAGLSVLDPRALERLSGRDPTVLIESALADAQFSEAPETLEVAGGITRLTLDYTGLNFRAPSRLRYRYRLLGLDRSWIQTDHPAPVVYTNLAPGDYRFEVQATIAPADFTGRSADALLIRIAPPWWRHPLVVAGLILLTLVLLRAAWRLRLRQLLQRERWLQVEVERRTAELRAQADRLLRLDREREQLLAELERLAREDELTGLPNRRAGEQLLREALADFHEQLAATPLAVALLDLDRFKSVNDRFGHSGGDAALRHLGQMLRGSGWFCARMGGEEFLLILPGCDHGVALAEVERLREAVQATRVPFGSRAFRIDFSAGVAVASAGDSAEQLCQRADERLYQAKAEGRGCVR